MVRTQSAFGESPEERIQVNVAEGRPKLTLVTRDGDPAPGMSVAIVTDAAPRVTLSLALIVEARVNGAGQHVSRRVDREAFFLQSYVSEKDRWAFFQAVENALKTPISKGDLDGAETRIAALGPLPSEPIELTEIDRCMGKFAVHDEQPAALVDVESARARAFSVDHVSFALVGSAGLGKEAAHALVETAEWPKAAKTPLARAPRTTLAGRGLSVPRGSVRVSVALPVADPRVSALVAEKVGKPLSPLQSKLQRLRVPFSVDEVAGVTKPNGGCIVVTATSNLSEQNSDLGSAARAASALIEAEIVRTSGETTDNNVAARQVLRTTDPVDAATIAAWWALAKASSEPPALSSTTALLDPDATDASVSATRDALAHATPPSASTLTLKARAERGQGELWVALADPCAVVEEAPHQWGAAAMVAMAESSASPSIDGVAIESLVDARGVGVFAHAAPLKGESPDDLAFRVSGAAAAALLGKPVTSDGLLEAQSMVRGMVERTWGHETLGLSAFAEALSPEHPTLIEPLGSFAQVSRSDPDRAARRWRALGQSGISLGVLANADDAQSTRAQESVSRWLTNGGSGTQCAQPNLSPRPGRSEVHGGGASHSAWLLLGIPTDRAPSAAIARSLLDGQSPASQSRAALSPIPGAEARAFIADGSVMVVLVQAPDEQIDTAEKAMRDLMGRMARGELPGATIRDAARDAEASDTRDLSDPRTRLRRLVFGGSFDPVRLSGPDLEARFKTFAQKALVDRRWVVVVAHPN